MIFIGFVVVGGGVVEIEKGVEEGEKREEYERIVGKKRRRNKKKKMYQRKKLRARGDGVLANIILRSNERYEKREDLSTCG